MITGRIYKIYNNINDKVYIGSTCCSLKDRYFKHKKNIYDKYRNYLPLYVDMKLYGKHNFNIELIEKIKIKDKSELHTLEGQYIKIFKDNNIPLYNKVINGRTQKEYRQERSKIKEQCLFCGCHVIEHNINIHNQTKKHLSNVLYFNQLFDVEF